VIGVKRIVHFCPGNEKNVLPHCEARTLGTLLNGDRITMGNSS
jgi:hypothetical protein